MANNRRAIEEYNSEENQRKIREAQQRREKRETDLKKGLERANALDTPAEAKRGFAKFAAQLEKMRKQRK